ncbi:MAG TPA: DUF2182 domain-containing protein [Sphingobium sp.]
MTRGPIELRSPATVALHHVLSRNSLIVGLALLLLAAFAWGWLWFAPGGGQATGDMAGMDMAGMDMGAMAMPADPWTTAYLMTAFAMWSIMMVAMMAPSAAPMILLHARIDRSESEAARLFHSALFIAAYLLVWTAFAAAAVGAQALLLDGGLLSAATLSIGSPAIIAAMLLLAAAYELTPAKGRCLENCQSPLIFIHRHWKPGADGAFRLGIRHGLYCVGCCWALMLLLFVGGVMNLAWIALLAIVATLEKVASPRWKAHRWVAALLLLAAVLVALR